MYLDLDNRIVGGGDPCTKWRRVLSTLILINFFIIPQVQSLYFSQKEVIISRTFLPNSGFLTVVKAIVGRDEIGQIQYGISKPEMGKGGNRTGKCLELIIDKNLGNVSVVLSTEEGDRLANHTYLGTNCRYKISAKLEENGALAIPDEKTEEMMLYLKFDSPLVIMKAEDSCREVSKRELCFGGLSHLELRVMENAPITPVAYLGALPGFCSTFKITYNVSIPDGVISAGKAPGEPLSDILLTKENLDRELVETYKASLNCIVESKEDTSKIELVQVEGKLKILDENDNVPMPGSEDDAENMMVIVSLSDHNYDMSPGKRIFSKEHTRHLARDADTLDVNSLRIRSLNDTKNLLDFSLKLYPAATVGLINSTAIIVGTSFSHNVKSIQPWDGYYCVLAVITDETVIPSKRGPDLNYTICINWGQKSVTARPAEKPSTEELLRRLTSSVVETMLPRSAQKYAPVMYPFPDLVSDVSEAVPGMEFSLTHIFGSYEDQQDSNMSEGGIMMSSSEYMDVFKVTPKMGIVYVNNPKLLGHSSFKSLHLQLFCNSTLIPSFSTNLTIFLKNPVTTEAACDEELCAVHADSKSCEMFCGYGSLGRCMWRHENIFNNSLLNEELDQDDVPRYPTCSPNLGTCPDRKCDEMEEMFPSLCPQDCATELIGFGRLVKRSNGLSYGINGEFCKGVGSCQHPHTCSCAHLPPPMESTIPPDVDSECGQECFMMYLGIAGIATAVIVISAYIWKARNERKRKARQLNHSVMMTANGIELPYGESNGHGTLMTDAEYMPRGLNHTTIMMSDDQFAQNQVFQIESKWEILREDLLLEHVLGEGQFGRVLKGRLHGHGGSHMPVAVKILKVDATEGSKSLWQEFMAEFSLLKQVDHPNVIKLLGACTTSGGPPYLVMEYAEYGALRSFLRKCRRVEKINGSNSALHWDSTDLSSSPSSDLLDLEYVVTPREVLGFSWQIAKGMAYLSDMKMVHRDLAARNILLTKLKVCKISDFGLTRDIYVDDAYQKKSKDRVPVKWLAPECLADELYTTKSDVWAFGILVWELTTLGASPYPGIQTEQLYSLLNTGYRMPQPQNCSNELYSLMRRCWAYQPTNRPTFHQIVLELSKMLEDGIEYLKLDFPSVSNPGYDYFSQADGTGSEVVNLSPVTEFTSEVRPSRRKLSMENLRLIDYEISTDGEFLNKRHSESRHTYINEPKPDQDCSRMKAMPSSSGYESPIRHPASVAV